MNQFFEYSILKYRPSYLLDERVNIGLLFRFQNAINRDTSLLKGDKFVFVHPNRLGRVSAFFPHLGKDNLSNIKKYFTAFSHAAKKISFQTENMSLQEAIPSKFIIDDANSFFFSEIKQGFYSNIETTTEYYKNDYFKYYDNSPTKKMQDTLVKEFFRASLLKLTDKDDQRLKYFDKDIPLQNKITTSRFEYRWQNGTLNLIKTLGFDLSDKQDIQDKAFKWKSAINYVHKEEKYKDFHFDILVGKPKNKDLFNAYDKALEVLEDIEANKKIIEGKKEIQDYAEKALDTVKPYLSE